MQFYKGRLPMVIDVAGEPCRTRSSPTPAACITPAHPRLSNHLTIVFTSRTPAGGGGGPAGTARARRRDGAPHPRGPHPGRQHRRSGLHVSGERSGKVVRVGTCHVLGRRGTLRALPRSDGGSGAAGGRRRSGCAPLALGLHLCSPLTAPPVSLLAAPPPAPAPRSLHGARCAATAAMHIALGDRLSLDAGRMAAADGTVRHFVCQASRLGCNARSRCRGSFEPLAALLGTLAVAMQSVCACAYACATVGPPLLIA